MECPLHDGVLTEDVRSVLLNFTVGYIIEEPADLKEYGLRFFEEANAYQDHKASEEERDCPPGSENELDTDFFWHATNAKGRRDGVCIQRESVERRRDLFEISTNQKLRIKLFLTKLFPFKIINEHLLNDIIDGMIRVEVEGGDTVMRQGDEAQNFFMIESGAYEEWITGNGVGSLLFRYESWGCFGLASLIFPHVAQATVIAKTDGALWAMNGAEYRSLVIRHEQNILELKRTCLESLPFISKLSHLQKEKLIDGIEFLQIKKDCSVITYSIHSNGLYYIRMGTVWIRYKNAKVGNEEISRVAGPGEHFGELSMFCARLSSTRAVALETCEILFLGAGSFERLLGPFNLMAFPHDIGAPLLGYGRWDDSCKVILYQELKNLIVEHRNRDHGDFLKFGLTYYKKPAETKSQHGDCNAEESLASETTCGEWGDGNCEVLMRPNPEISAENLTYAIEKVCPKADKFVRLMDILRAIPIFGALSEFKLGEVVGAMQLVTVYTGHYVVKSGKLGQYFYVIEEGEFRTVVNGDGVTHEILDCPNYFGELGLIMDVPRFADVIAITKGSLWALSRDDFRKIADSFPVRRKGLNYKLVRNIKNLGSLIDYDVKALSLSLQNVIYKDRDVIHSFQEDSNGLYFVKRGTIRIHSTTLKQSHKVVRNEQSFGFLVFSMEKCDDLKAQSVGMSKIALLKIEAFEQLLGHCRKVLYQNKCLQSKYWFGLSHFVLHRHNA